MRTNPISWWLPDVGTLLRRHSGTPVRATNVDLSAWALFALVVCAPLGVALVPGVLEKGSLLVVTGLLLVVFRPLLDRLARGSHWGAYQAVVSSWTLTLLGVLSTWGAWFAINLAGFRRDLLFPETAPQWFVAASLGVPTLVWGASRGGRVSAGWWMHGERLRHAARALWVATAMLTCVACASRQPEFDRQHYFETLPRIAFHRAVSSLPRVEPRSGEQSAEVHEGRVEDLGLHAVCRGEGWCDVSLAQTPEAGERLNPWRFWGVWVKRDEPLDVRRDRARGLLLVRRPYAIRALRARDGERIDVPAAAFGEHAGPPRPWVFGAAIGLALAAWVLRRRDRMPVGTWAPAIARDDRVVCENGIDARVVPALGVSGAVLVAGGIPAVSAYREDGEIDAARVYPGTPEDLARATHASAITHDAVAFATLVLTSAPLWTAAARGMAW